MNGTDLQVLFKFRSEVPRPDEAAKERVYRLATAGRLPRRRFSALPAPRRPRLVVFAAAAALTVAGAASALAIYTFGPSPGFSAGFSAFDQHAPAPWPDSVPRVALERSAAYVGVSTSTFLQRLRLLRTGLSLGPGRSDGLGELYAYIGDNGETGCMFLTGQTGTCFKANYARHVRGVLPVINPGYPGQTPALTAIVADNVKSLELNISNRLTRQQIINNSVYVDLARLQKTDTVALRITYDDGSTAGVSLVNPLTEVSPSKVLGGQ
jgi:hypothetical protein